MHPGAPGRLCPSQSSENRCPGHELHQAESRLCPALSDLLQLLSILSLFLSFPISVGSRQLECCCSAVGFAICDE